MQTRLHNPGIHISIFRKKWLHLIICEVSQSEELDLRMSLHA